MNPIVIEILSKPGQDCDQMEKTISWAASKLNLPIKIKKTSNFGLYTHISVNPAHSPIVIIAGQVEFAKITPQVEVVLRRLAEIRDRRGGAS